MMEDNVRKGMCIYICVCVYLYNVYIYILLYIYKMTGSLYCTAEIGTTLYINYTLKKIFFKKGLVTNLILTMYV